MGVPALDQLICLRRFPPVVHPRHARELLAGAPGALAEWTSGYAITAPEHRQLLEELLGSLAWKPTGQAALINGLYGTGKSHLLVLLHLLIARPEAWTPFVAAHPVFTRYATAMQAHRRLVVHFSLDEYGPQQPLERALQRETLRALAEAGIPSPEDFTPDAARSDAWGALLDTCRAHGLNGIVLLLDEVSLFLAGKSPAQREADAAFLQFLAGWTARAPVWLIGALQRHLADTGALRTHSWRQVEDRFRRHTLSPQGISQVVREKLIQRTDLAAIRALIAAEIIPATDALGLPITAGELQTHWPFHPAALDLLASITTAHLSPHRSLIETVGKLEETAYWQRPATRLLIPLDLFTLVIDDLQRLGKLDKLWSAVALLGGCAEDELGRDLVHLLALLHLAERPATVAQLRALLFDGQQAPSLQAISATLHGLRRRGAYLAVARDADPAAELFTLAVDDEISALARARMQEMRQEFTPDDSRIVETALLAGDDPTWPLAATLAELRMNLPWHGSERSALISLIPALTTESIARAYEGLLAGAVDARMLLCWPETGADAWPAATAGFTDPRAEAFYCWLPRAVTVEERDLWTEYAAWARAAQLPAASAREKRIGQRCTEHAQELRPAVTASLRALYGEGRWRSAHGDAGTLPPGESMVESLAALLDPGLDRLFPYFTMLAPHGTPSPAATQQLLAHFIDPGEVPMTPGLLLGDYIERFAEPLGCAYFADGVARVAPPRWEILEPLLAKLAYGPLHQPDALAFLRQPPLGLTAEQAKLTLFAAARQGAVQPLDGFLQPLDPESIAPARSDALAFISLPEAIDAQFHPTLRTLATCWEQPVDPWPIASQQLLRRLRGIIREWQAELSSLRTALAEWTTACGVLPWAWQGTERALSGVTTVDATHPLNALPVLFPDGEIALLDTMIALRAAARWWQERAARLELLRAAPLTDVMMRQFRQLTERLATGEGCFAELPALGARADELWMDYVRRYRAWHDATFGTTTVAALRQAFDLTEFRAVKLLARLPLPLPDAATRCLEALAHARTGFCPGDFTRLEADGCCARCRQPLGSPSPMPDAASIGRDAGATLEAYGHLLSVHAWAREIRERLPRAPEAIASRVTTLLAWTPEHGAEALLSLLDESVLAWLCRDRRTAGSRDTRQLESRLRGHDLTLAEARQSLQNWLDPDSALDGETLLSFE